MTQPLDEHLLAAEEFLASAGVLITNPSGEVLVLRTTYKPEWEIPGGLVDRGEHPHAAAMREVREEIGIDLDVGPLLCVDFRRGWERNPRPMLHFVFDGGVIENAAFSLAEDEIAEAAFLPIAAAAERTGERVGGRLTVALRAREAGRAVYLSEGRES